MGHINLLLKIVLKKAAQAQLVQVDWLADPSVRLVLVICRGILSLGLVQVHEDLVDLFELFASFLAHREDLGGHLDALVEVRGAAFILDKLAFVHVNQVYP